MAREVDSGFQAKILQVSFCIVFMLATFVAFRNMMFGSKMLAKMLFLGFSGAAVVIALDNRYWLLPVFLFGFYRTIPQLKFTGAELGSLILVAVFIARRAIHRDERIPGFWLLLLAALPFMFWMCLVWSMNPVGMNMFGSSRIGGRFYFKVILAFLTMFCLSFIRVGERECKWLGLTTAAGYIVYVLSVFVFGSTDELGLNGVLHYELIRVSFVAPLFLCRFTPPELLARLFPLLGFLVCFALSVYSGNRTAAARPALVGLLSPFFCRRDRMKTLLLAMLAAVVLCFVVAGHGRAWNLPYSVQRSLSFLPGKWDWRLQSYGFQDNFRKKLRFFAREHIAQRPWFGDGGFSLDYEEMAWTAANLDQEGINLHVLSRNWHNVWLGMAADFGIPLSVAWALFMAVLLLWGGNETKFLPPCSWQQTMYLYFYLLILVEFFNFFFNGGHSAKTAEQIFVWAGLMTAVRNGVRYRFGLAPRTFSA